MEKLLQRINDHLNKDLQLISISNPRRSAEVRRLTVRPVLIRQDLMFQLASYTDSQVFHENLTKEKLMERLGQLLPLYKQLQLKSTEGTVTALINKKNKAAIRIHPRNLKEDSGTETLSVGKVDLSHNRKKKYLLKEGEPVAFLVDLGVMTREGKVVRSKYDKFRQINRFLEFIDDILPYLPRDRELTILDFGCGKSYLTFAVYHYLHEMKSLPVHIIGLDLKKDVIRRCGKLARTYGYDDLEFLEGSIEDYEGVDRVDMVITLHACDTATDYALFKAIRWGAEVILSVPCCQHELNKQIAVEGFDMIADYGILKERYCALATDGIRASLLSAMGYETQILEFIDMEHTPKNLLIRAVAGKKPSKTKWMETEAFCRQFHFDPTLYRLLKESAAAEKML